MCSLVLVLVYVVRFGFDVVGCCVVCMRVSTGVSRRQLTIQSADVYSSLCVEVGVGGMV